ncbi:MAG: DUF362 domain-containing protein [Candidatus Omnitrophota bacterium]
MPDVFFKKITNDELLKNPHTLLGGIEKLKVLDTLQKGAFVALKLHLGEKGNKSYINPIALGPLVKLLKKTQVRPFLFETNTLYRGERMNAIDHIILAHNHGFAKLDVPIIIGDGIRGGDYIEVKIDKKHFDACFMAQGLKDIDCLIVLSHLTGHMLTGFGAAIKNLGMGCASRRGKLAQHCDVSPEIIVSRCIRCGRCMENCPAAAIERNQENYRIVKEKCIGCAQCVSVCPKGAVNIMWSESYEAIGEKLVEYAYAATRERKCVYINFCVFITQECDCMNKEEKGFVKDIGLLFSHDPVAVDKASIDLLLQQENRDALREIHPKIDYLHHLRYAHEIGLGSLEYTLIEI